MRSLPLFHRIAGQPVAVLGEGEAAAAKARLVQRAGGVPIGDLAKAQEQGARLAFIAHDDPAQCEADADAARCAAMLVNVVDRPDLCDFTTPSLLDRDPVLIAVGTSGASAGLAKQLRLRLDGLLPADLGMLASRLSEIRGRLKEKFPKMGDRRRVLDAALGAGGPLDPLAQGGAGRVEAWLADSDIAALSGAVRMTLTSNDPDDLTLRQARMLGSADCIIHDSAIAPAILDRARADARRVDVADADREDPQNAQNADYLVVIITLSSVV